MIVCLIVFVGAGSVILDYFLNINKQQNVFTDTVNLKKVDDKEIVTEKGVVSAKYAALYRNNPDIIGWVKAGGTKIDYPIMQTVERPKYYLHVNFNDEYSDAGTPFMDARSDIFTPTKNFLIYGHNMKSGMMFHDLIKYEDIEYYKKHKYIKFDTIYKDGEGKYKIIAACRSRIKAVNSSEFKYLDYADIMTEEKYNRYIDGIKSEACYDTKVDSQYGDQLVTLSTCAYHTKNGRFYIVAKKIN